MDLAQWEEPFTCFCVGARDRQARSVRKKRWRGGKKNVFCFAQLKEGKKKKENKSPLFQRKVIHTHTHTHTQKLGFRQRYKYYYV